MMAKIQYTTEATRITEETREIPLAKCLAWKYIDAPIYCPSPITNLDTTGRVVRLQVL